MRGMKCATLLLTTLWIGCGGGGGGGGDDGTQLDAPGGGDGSVDSPSNNKAITTIFVIAFENKDQTQVVGNTNDAPYINSLLVSTAAHASKFGDVLPSLPSEPHYVWMEGGTNAFPDHTFEGDGDPSATNSTSTTTHLVTQLMAASIPWMSYQEGITSGTCPIATSGHYAPKHDPMLFFQDIVGNPPSAASPVCAAHHKSYADFPADLAAGGLKGYIFITPDICHDMHGALDCPSGVFDSANIRAGDDWLKAELPRLIEYTKAHDDSVIFLVWDEGTALFSTNIIPFIAIGKHVVGGKDSTVAVNHSSYVKSIELLLGVPVLPNVASANDFRDMFVAGVFR